MKPPNPITAAALTNASGFFFERDNRLYLVTSRHVVIDEASQHLPDRLEIELRLVRRHADDAHRPGCPGLKG